MRFPLAFLAALLLLPAAASAQLSGAHCNSCESCTAALAVANAIVELDADVDASQATTCVRIAGRGATFEGGRHTLRGAAVGVEVAADEVVVRNLQVQEGGVGLQVTRARNATLFNDAVHDARAGVRIEGSANTRVVRASLSRNRVGVSMGADEAGRCAAPGPIASPGVVIVRSQIAGGGVGVAACDAVPVLIGNLVSGNDRGVVIGEVRAQGGGPQGGPWDDCSCAPGPGSVAPGTLMLYSSGCGGCIVHESWLTEERSHGAQIRVRPGPEGNPEQVRFDEYMRRCAPEVMGALGIPGCVPNYSCPASGEVWKRRDGERQLAVDRSLNTPAEVVAFSEQCRAAGRAGYARGPRCVAAALRDNTLCGNRQADLESAGSLSRWGLSGDRCGVVRQPDGGVARCERGCEGAETGVSSTPFSPAPTTPAATHHDIPSIEETPVDAGAPARRAAPRTAAPAGSSGHAAWWVMGGMLAIICLAAWRPWVKRG